MAIELCSKMVNIRIFVYEVRKDEIHMYSYKNVPKTITTISLLFSNSHYDILEKNENIQAEDSVIKNTSDYYSTVSEKMVSARCIECG